MAHFKDYILFPWWVTEGNKVIKLKWSLHFYMQYILAKFLSHIWPINYYEKCVTGMSV